MQKKHFGQAKCVKSACKNIKNIYLRQLKASENFLSRFLWLSGQFRPDHYVIDVQILKFFFSLFMEYTGKCKDHLGRKTHFGQGPNVFQMAHMTP